ncbi:hypothetical protein IAD21_03181 [Abditibacteriota bacterium]|nr:hypothetical protein IAD21_03181 [Abditibacteriota bacterium]
MTPPQLSPQQRKQADQIYNRGLWTGGFLAFGVLMLLNVITASASGFISRVTHHATGNPVGWTSGLVVLAGLFVNAFATRQVRRAGLSLDHIESRSIPKTITQFHGNPIVLRAENSVGLGIAGLIACGAMLFILRAIQESSEPFSPFFIDFGMVLFIVMGGSSLYLLTKPIALQLDALGVKGSKNGFWSRRVSWEQVSTMEIRQAFNYKGLPTLKTLVFLNNSNSILIRVPLSSFIIEPDQIDEFITSVEAKLIRDFRDVAP